MPSFLPNLKIDVRTDIKQIALSMGALPDQVDKAASRALNRVANKVRSQAAKEISDIYAIPQKRLKFGRGRAIAVIKATPITLQAIVEATGRRQALSYFAHRVPKNRKRPIKVKVLRSRGYVPLKGNPRFAGKPFRAVMKSGHVGIFQRETTARDSTIKQLFSIDVPYAFTSKKVFEIMRDIIKERFPIEFERDLDYRINKFIGRY